MKPNWEGSIADSTTSFNALAMMKLLATFDKVDVSEIRLRSLLKLLIVDAFGNGGTWRASMREGLCIQKKDVFKISAMGASKMTAYSFNTQFGDRLGRQLGRY